MARIVVLDGHTLNPGDLSWEPLAALGTLDVFERTPRELVVPRAAGAAVVVTNKTYVGAAELDQLHGLAGIAVLATGFDVVDAVAAKERGIPVCNVPAYSTASVAQHVFALLLELTTHVGRHAAGVRDGVWSRSVDFTYWEQPLTELDGLTFGIVGLGAIGQRVAVIARAFGMKVLATPSRRLRSLPEGVEFRDCDALFAECDVISLHCPLTAETRGLVSAERLRMLRKTALLINTARGALIDEEALARALESDALGGAGLDALTIEPPPLDHPLLRAPRCVITPHQAWTTRSARERLLAVTLENVAGILARKPHNVVNA